jgi:mannose-6-phosphate isomerase-like protein (cupin superfamily)
MNPSLHISKPDRSRFRGAHNDSVYCQPLFDHGGPDERTLASAFAYSPCWAILDPGMSVEPHQHAIAELYVFVRGAGTMRLDAEEFEVAAGMAVSIPPNAVHTVANSPTAAEELVWASFGFKEVASADR